MKRLFFLTVFCILLCVSCGLETFYEIEPPKDAFPQNPADGLTLSPPVYSSATRKFEFTAVKNDTFIAWGTEVYYRIYDSLEKLQSDAKSINAVNADQSTAGFYRLQSLNYRRLRTEQNGGIQDLLIEGVGRVKIRLIDEVDGFGVFYGGSSLPVFRENNTLFYFGSSDSVLNPPENGNTDFTYTASAEDFFYVNAYAVSTGLQSASWTRAVSKVLPLGFCAFKK